MFGFSVTSLEDIQKILNVWISAIATERSNLEKAFNESFNDFFTTNINPPILLNEETLKQNDDHDPDENEDQDDEDEQHDEDDDGEDDRFRIDFKVCRLYYNLFETHAKNYDLSARVELMGNRGILDTKKFFGRIHGYQEKKSRKNDQEEIGNWFSRKKEVVRTKEGS